MNKVISRSTLTLGCLGLIGMLISCTPQKKALVEIDSANTEEEISTTKSNSSVTKVATIPNSALVPTQPLEPTPIKITVADLPEPYATRSISNLPNVIPVPANPVLKVPSSRIL